MVKACKWLLIALALCLIGWPPAAKAAGDAEAQTIRHLLMTQFDRPREPLTVAPIVVAGDIAIAGWAQGEQGGRALLRRQSNVWKIALCAGDALKDAAILVQVGVSPDTATRLAASLQSAEGALAPDYVARLSRFDGIVTMNDDEAHPSDHPHDTGRP